MRFLNMIYYNWPFYKNILNELSNKMNGHANTEQCIMAAMYRDMIKRMQIKDKI